MHLKGNKTTISKTSNALTGLKNSQKISTSPTHDFLGSGHQECFKGDFGKISSSYLYPFKSYEENSAKISNLR